MNYFRKLLLGKEAVKQLELLQKRSIFTPGTRYAISPGGVFISPADNEQDFIANGYNLNDIVYSCVQLILDKVRVAPWGLFQVESESSLKQYKAIMMKKNLTAKDYITARKLRKEALVPLDNLNLQTGKLAELLKYPNETDTWADFVTYGCQFKLVTGNKYIKGEPLKAGANAGIPDSLEVLPSQYTRIIIDNGFPAKAIGYQVFMFGQQFEADQVLHEKYPNLTWSINGLQLYGMSPLKTAIAGVVARDNSAVKASGAMFKNRGMDDIIFIDNPELTPEQGLEQAAALKAKMVNEYSGEDATGKRAFSGQKVGSVQLGLSSKDMEIIAAEKWNLSRICNIYGVPSQLLNDKEASTYNNLKEAEKALTTRSALPLLTSFRDQLNRKLQTVWGFKGKNVYLDFDMNVYTELMEDMKDTAAWMDKIPLTPNEKREAAGFECFENPEFDEPWITPAMGQPYSEWELNEVDQNINDDSEGNQAGGDA